MTVAHHPSDELIEAYVSGRLDEGQRIAVATHLAACPECLRWRRSLDQAGGMLLERTARAPMSPGALARAEARLDDVRPAPAQRRDVTTDVPGLPAFLRRRAFGKWRWIGPGVHMRPLPLKDSPTRVFLLRSAPGSTMLRHSHTGVEMTCVLTGAFSHEAGRFGPGDFDFGDGDVDHQPVVDAGEACTCLVAMTGGLKLRGLIGRLMQPFVRL